jgi:hypothetical protein
VRKRELYDSVLAWYIAPERKRDVHCASQLARWVESAGPQVEGGDGFTGCVDRRVASIAQFIHGRLSMPATRASVELTYVHWDAEPSGDPRHDRV